jgi:hypothetical protein
MHVRHTASRGNSESLLYRMPIANTWIIWHLLGKVRRLAYFIGNDY